MSAVADALKAVRDALLLADQVKRLGQALAEKDLEIRQLDRRVTRLEAQWDTAMAYTGARPKRPRIGHDD